MQVIQYLEMHSYEFGKSPQGINYEKTQNKEDFGDIETRSGAKADNKSGYGSI